MNDKPSYLIRSTRSDDLPALLEVHGAAFGNDKEPQLVRDLLEDPTAAPRISLVAELDGALIGHVLFTRVELIGEGPSPRCSLLAPLAVVPKAQGAGIGQRLMRAALDAAAAHGQALVFVLGHPGYYPKAGFRTAGRLGFAAPYPIPDVHADAWMVAELAPGAIAKHSGTVKIAEKLDRPEYWRE